MKFQELCIGDLFNTKSARWVKVDTDRAIVVMSALLQLGTVSTLTPAEDVVLLWSSILATEEQKQAQEDQRFLGCLQAAGVDNWDGYGIALEMFQEGE